MFGFFLFFYSFYLLFSSDPNPIQHCLVYRYGSAVKNLNKFYTCIGQGDPKKLRLKPNVRYFMVALYFEAIAWMRLSKSDRNEMFGYFWSENQLEFVGKLDLTQRIWSPYYMEFQPSGPHNNLYRNWVRCLFIAWPCHSVTHSLILLKLDWSDFGR